MISNDWELIDNLTYLSVNSEEASSTIANFLDETSARKLASAIGWEVVTSEASFLTISTYTYNSEGIYLIRPIDDNEYPYAWTFVNAYISSWRQGLMLFDLTTGIYTTYIYYNGVTSSVLLLRPTAQGGFFLRRPNTSNFDVAFDTFYNPKTQVTKWAVTTVYSLFDFWSGLYLSSLVYSNLYEIFTMPDETGQFVALKKFTAYNSDGVFNARTIYKSYIDYSNADKTIELGGIRYRAIRTGYGTPLYIPLI